jgi:ankyrin repeat protein
LLLDHFGKNDGPTHRSSQDALDLAQKIHPELVPILEEGMKRNRAALTAQLTSKLHSIRIDLPAFSSAPLQKVTDFLLQATSKAGYLERRVAIGSLNLPPTTTITSPARTNISLWDALQTLVSTNGLRFDVDDHEVGCITLYRPQDEAVIHPSTNKDASQSALTEPGSKEATALLPNAQQAARIVDAVKRDDSAALSKLVSGLNVGKIEVGNEPLLFLAKSPGTVKVLLDHGADANARDKAGNSAWGRLCLNSPQSAAIAQVLLDHGADPNAALSSSGGPTPLFYARDAATVNLLIKHGANIRLTTAEGSTVLTQCALYKPNVFDTLVENGVPFDVHTDGPALLVRAAWIRNAALVKDLLARGVDPNADGVFAHSLNGKPDLMKPLQASAISGATEVTKILLDHGARGDDEMVTALHNRNAGVVKMLWDHGVRSISPLCFAVSQGAPVGDLQKLLDAGSPADPPQDARLTPLAMAASMGNMEMVKLLVARGADVNKGNVFNPKFPIYHLSPLVTAAAEGQDEIVSFLLAHGATADPIALWQAAENSTPYLNQLSRDHFEKTVRILLDAGALKSATQEEQGYILSGTIGTRQGPPNINVAKMLLDAGADPKAPMPYLVENGQKADSVNGYFQSCYAKDKADPKRTGQAAELKPVIDVLDAKAGEKNTSTSFASPVQQFAFTALPELEIRVAD